MVTKQQSLLHKWELRAGLLVSLYRIVALAMGIGLVLVFPSSFQSLLSRPVLFVNLSLYVLVTSVYFFFLSRRKTGGIILLIMIILDIAEGYLIVYSTGGIHSPFLALLIAPILTAALFLRFLVTAVIGVLSVAYIISIQYWVPFNYSLTALGYNFVPYLVSVSLAVLLPYLVNVNVREKLKLANTVRERHRLSRELHDGEAQTTSALLWQIDVLKRRLKEKDVDLDEMKELEWLANKIHHETRESLELLRDFSGNGGFLSYLKDYASHLNREPGLSFLFDISLNCPKVDSVAELELLSICQEALTNTMKHSGAHNVLITVKPVNKHLSITIADNGRGFDVGSYYHSSVRPRGHGLAIMDERAASVGGKFRVLSFPGKGTEVQIEMPISSGRGH